MPASTAGIQGLIGLQKADQDLVGEGVHLGIHFGGLSARQFRVPVDFDHRFDQGIAEEEERLGGIHITQLVAAGA